MRLAGQQQPERDARRHDGRSWPPDRGARRDLLGAGDHSNATPRLASSRASPYPGRASDRESSRPAVAQRSARHRRCSRVSALMRASSGERTPTWRCDHHARKRGQPEPGRPRLIRDPDRPWQPRAERSRVRVSRRSSAFARHCPVSASSTAATIFVACTSTPTRDRALAMAGFAPIRVVGRPRGVYAARAQLTARTTRRDASHVLHVAGRTVNPYCLTSETYPTNGARR